MKFTDSLKVKVKESIRKRVEGTEVYAGLCVVS